MVSIIIPTLNEESCIATTLAQLHRQRPLREIIVVDGGSTDATVGLAAEQAVVLTAQRGRANQMNHGASAASGDVLLFLHADCTLAAGALEEAVRCLKRRDVAGGCFMMSVTDRALLYRSIEACATARVRLTGIIYGDQGLFVRRELFQQLGGFPPVQLMEDVLLSLMLRRHGRMVLAPKRIYVSPRRWQRNGIVRQTLRNWLLTALAAGGVHPNQLAAFYPAVR